MFQKIRRKSEWDCMWSTVCMCIQGIPVEIPTPTHRNLIGRTTTAPPVVLSPSRMFSPPSSHCIFLPARKIFREFQIMLSVFFLSCLSLKLRNAGSVCPPYRSHLFCMDKRQVFWTSCPWISSHCVPHNSVRSKTNANFSLWWSRCLMYVQP